MLPPHKVNIATGQLILFDADLLAPLSGGAKGVGCKVIPTTETQT